MREQGACSWSKFTGGQDLTGQDFKRFRTWQAAGSGQHSPLCDVMINIDITAVMCENYVRLNVSEIGFNAL